MKTDIPSPVVGTILELHAAAGAVVAAGDEVVVIESMKMEIPIAAPVAGRVVKVAVAVGDRVQAGDLLLTIDH